ncbi:MAG: hypothetical protein GY754_41955 [bacterium]|nr:hypothetical protein [bacterium]
MKIPLFKLTLCFILILLLFPSCFNLISDAERDDASKAITAFSFTAGANGLSSDVTARIEGSTITAVVPKDTPVDSLVADFTTTGKSVCINGVIQTSGSGSIDFTDPVVYTVTAWDNSSTEYTVTVYRESSPGFEDSNLVLVEHGRRN